MYLNLGAATTVLQPTHEEGKQYDLLRKIQKSQGGDVEEIHCLVYYRRRGRFFVGSTAPLAKGGWRCIPTPLVGGWVLGGKTLSSVYRGFSRFCAQQIHENAQQIHESAQQIHFSL